MIASIFVLILCSHAINSAKEVWDLNSPLIVNKNGNEVSFPRYVAEETKSDSSQDSTIIYKEPGDTSTSTHFICKDEANPAISKSTQFEENSEHNCPKLGLRLYRQVVVDGNKKSIYCGNKNRSSSNYIMYSRYIDLNIDETKSRLVFYHYCYDSSKTQSTLYGYYDVDNPSLLGNKLLAEEQNYKQEMLETITSKPNERSPDNEISTTYKKQSDYDAFEVVTSAFAPFGHWIRAFYQWPNTAPMNKDLTPVWKQFVKNVRREISKKKEPIKVYSGVYNVLRVNGLIQYLSNNKTTIPEFWWILLYNKNKTQGVSLIMHNYSYGFDENKVEPLCGESVCGDVGLQGAIPQGEGYNQANIYCCPASTIATKFDFDEDDELLKFTKENSIALQ